MFRKLAMTALCAVFLSACGEQGGQQTESHTVSQPVKKVWVFAQINIPEDDKIDTYWYYGRVSDALYQDISNNRVTEGFIRLTQIHYWADDAVHPYEDEDDAGEMVFRIEDLRKVSLVKRLPVIPEQHENTLADIEATESE